MDIAIDQHANNQLIEAYKSRDIDKFCELIESGANVNCLNEDKKSLISIIITEDYYNDSVKFFDKLIESNVYLGQIGIEKGLLSLSAELSDSYYLNKLLKTKNININSLGVYGTERKRYGPVIYEMMRKGEKKNVDLILQNNIDLGVSNEWGTPLLNFLITSCLKSFNSKEMKSLFKNLIDQGYDVNSRSINGMQILHCLVIYDQNNLLEYLLNMNLNIDLNSRDKIGNTALLYAAELGCNKSAKILIEKKANLNIINTDGESALLVSARYDNNKIFEMLMNSSSDLTIGNKNKNNVLHLMASNYSSRDNMRKFNKYFKIILKKHPSMLYDKNINGATPLNIIEEQGNHTKYICTVYKNMLKELNKEDDLSYGL